MGGIELELAQSFVCSLENNKAGENDGNGKGTFGEDGGSAAHLDPGEFHRAILGWEPSNNQEADASRANQEADMNRANQEENEPIGQMSATEVG